MPSAAYKTPVLILFGPTASGKTALLEELFGRAPESGGEALGKAICRAEVISADSMQVYRGMDIGTAKPSLEEQARIPHHLIDIRDPSEQFNAGDFVRLAGEAVYLAANRSALPVVSGGTGFYIKNLIMGLPASPPSDPGIRSALKEELERQGAASLMKELVRDDPVSAARIHPNDEYRLLRALEVYRLTGRPLSSYAQNRAGEEFRFLILGIKWDREELYKRINERCINMFKRGLPDEVKRLYEAGCTPLDPGMRAIGYREFFVEREDASGFPLSDQTPLTYTLTKDLAGVKALVTQNSRRYAKRQLVFFNSIPGVTWIEGKDTVKAVTEIRKKLDDFLDTP